MAKRREKTRLELIANTIEVAALRLRIANDIGDPAMHRRIAKQELINARDALQSEIDDIEV